MKVLPKKIKSHICLFLDTQSLCNLASVSKDWKSFSEDEKIWKEKLSKITQYQDKTKASKAIFAQITILKRKNSSDLLAFAVTSPQNAKLVVETPELFDEMNLNGLNRKRNIVLLAQSHPETAKFLFQTPKFGLFIDTQDLFKIAKTNSESARLVLQNYTFAYDRCKDDLLEIAEMYPEAKEIISNKYPQSSRLTFGEKMISEYRRKFAP